MSYANKTTVPVGKTKVDIEKLLKKAGSSGYANAQRGRMAFVAFQVKDIGIKIKIELPAEPSVNATNASIRTYDQLCRSKWRCLLLVIKAKIESIESGIETFEQAFLSHIVLSNGDLVGDKIIPNIRKLNEVPTSLLLGL